MTIRQWQIIDATIDNEVDSNITGGDPRGVVPLGKSIREAGWDQATDASRAWRPCLPYSARIARPDNNWVSEASWLPEV
ncbi:hypothetical protein GCM10017556_19820 [Micromonospora sagamiensis]|nr:hypothetical protein GCM10017556_19820 [Micromonospora sagamiensis]